MKTTLPPTEVRLPKELQSLLSDYRRNVWSVKVVEIVAVALCFLLLAWLSVFLLDRFFDAPSWMRGTALVVVLASVALIPWGLYRWVWRRRTLPQVARLISRKLPSAGDRLLGVLELIADKQEQARSRVLCQAAVEQVADESRLWALEKGLPTSRNRSWWRGIAVLGVILIVIGFLAPEALRSAWVRMTSPWGNSPRYTFAALREVSTERVVPHGEPFRLTVELNESSRWRPATGKVTVGAQSPIVARLVDGTYTFEIPQQVNGSLARLSIGDARRKIALKPTLRPELQSVFADVTLPDYLQRSGRQEHDVRGGTISLVHGSRVHIRAKANRELETATVDGVERFPHGAEFTGDETMIEQSRDFLLRWKDTVGLAGKRPFTIVVKADEDEAPTVSCTGIRRQLVVLVSEQVSFQIQARDDFGIREVGMQWQGFGNDGKPSETVGTRVLAAGGPDREALNATGTFKADALGIAPQPIEMRLYAKDYLSDREPIVSPPFLFYVLSPDQHAIWVTEQLSKWHRRALEIRDRELKLYADNRQLREMPDEQLQTVETQQRIRHQANAEKSNGRRLANLTGMGEEILQQATRNPEFGVGHLEKWAEMLQILKDISANRMPSVADLLQDAAEAPELASNASGKASSPEAGTHRNRGNTPSGSGAPDDKDPAIPPPVPQIVDSESADQPLDSAIEASGESKKPGSPSLSLPVTILVGKSKSSDACAASDFVHDAVEEQKDLLAEFEKVANELNDILANLEGSTLVKRLKAASRRQWKLSGSIGDLLEATFGAKSRPGDFESITSEEEFAVIDVSYIMDDMQAYFDRRPFVRFKTVLSEMRETDVIGSLRRLGDDIPEETGVSMAQCDYWADSFDRWAEDLVDPTGGGT